jgi:WD40 repeat protein
MKRSLPIWAISIAVLSLGVLACSLIGQAAGNSNTAGDQATSANGTIIAVTSSIPTATAGATSNALPPGTLILMQLGRPIAQPLNASGQTISLPAEHFGSQASPDGRYGVAINADHSLSLVDFTVSTPPSATANATTPSGQAIPQGTGMKDPHITWKPDSSGFAFFDFSPSAQAGAGAIYYYDLASKQTKPLVSAPAQSGMIATSIEFSQDGKYLAYATGSAGAEGVGGPDSKLFVLDTTSNQSTPLPAGLFGFTRWLRDSQSFIVRRLDKQSGTSQFVVYSLASLNNPKVLTPANTSDFLVDISPDGKHIVVSTAPKGRGQVTNIAIMNLDGSNRKALTKFTAADQSTTGLVWGNDGIYYSVQSADNKVTTWRIDLDGSNATQIAQGTLIAIVGIH